MGRSSLEQLLGEETHVERLTQTSRLGWSGQIRAMLEWERSGSTESRILENSLVPGERCADAQSQRLLSGFFVCFPHLFHHVRQHCQTSAFALEVLRECLLRSTS